MGVKPGVCGERPVTNRLLLFNTDYIPRGETSMPIRFHVEKFFNITF